VPLRYLVNALAGAAFVIGLPAVLLVDSAVRYAESGEALVESARSAGLREAMVDATAALVVGEVARDPTAAAVDRVFVRGAVDRVLSAEWFDDTIRSIHAAGLAGVSRAAGADLEPFKAALRERLGLLEERAGSACRDLFGETPCRDRSRAQELIAAYQRRAQRAVARIPDHILIWRDAGGAEDLGLLVTARWAGLGLLLTSALALALANRRRPGALGGFLAAAGGLSLAIFLALRLAAAGPIAHVLIRRAEIDERADPPVRIAAAGLRRLADEVVADATRTGLIAAGAIAAVGLGLVAAAQMRSRTRQVRAASG